MFVLVLWLGSFVHLFFCIPWANDHLSQKNPAGRHHRTRFGWLPSEDLEKRKGTALWRLRDAVCNTHAMLTHPCSHTSHSHLVTHTHIHSLCHSHSHSHSHSHTYTPSHTTHSHSFTFLQLTLCPMGIWGYEGRGGVRGREGERGDGWMDGWNKRGDKERQGTRSCRVATKKAKRGARGEGDNM
ncbi:MAG: hypothetical protein J3Q66DRAFT_346763 [Benniella sp.]|nr:MAG: hypothetical protein J3Q66DRAFT_346763 [Benniella sp.]